LTNKGGQSLMITLIHIFLILMNFFFLHLDPKKCARYHGDKHLNKMQTEYAQILSFVWYILVFEDIERLGSEFNHLKERIPYLKSNMYQKNKAHLKHPVVLWASRSMAHYMAIVNLGLALGEEKRRRMDNMDNLPKQQRKLWKRHHKSEETLNFLRDNIPPLALFPDGNVWSDPPKCMPSYLHNDETGNPFTVIQSYQLFYSGNKIQIANLKWEPFVEEPDFLSEWQSYINTRRPDIQQGIENDLKKYREDKSRSKKRRELKKQKAELNNSPNKKIKNI
jgi:hypothetical protein